MTRRRSVLVLIALVLGAAGAALLLARDVALPGTRGAARLASGFRPGRWDARFLVARGPAVLALPHAAMRVTLTLSGPARATARYDGGAAEQAFADAATPWSLDLPSGGPVSIEADGALRLHELRVERLTRGPSLAFARLALLSAWDRWRPLLVAALLGLAIVGTLIAARARPGAVPSPRIPAAVGALLFLSCALQVTLRAQPLIIGDPGAYYDMGARFREALQAPAALGDALQDLRPYGGLAFTGALYGTLRLVRDHPTTIHLAHALAMAGVGFFLVRAAARLGGRLLALVTGALALIYPTFPIICGIVQPEPFILLLWCFAFDRIVAVTQGDAPPRLVAAGLAFALGLALHPQGIWYLLAAAVLVLAPFALALRHVSVRRRVLAFALGVAPIAAATAVGEAYARPAVHVLDTRYGFFAYTSAYPLGFWLFVDTDGWQGPVRIDQTRYALELDAEREAGPVNGLAFTARFVARNAAVSLRTVLRNLHRLYRFPDNPFHRTWILPFGVQVRVHQAIVVGFLLSVPLLFGRRAAGAIVPVAMLAATYPLYHVFNKYALPATPFLILGASLLPARLVERRPRLLIAALAVAAVVALPRPALLAFAGMNATAAHATLLGLQAAALLAAFVWTLARWSETRLSRLVGGVALAGMAAAWIGAEWDDPSWRAFETNRPGARQEIELDDAALDLLRNAREAYLALDLRLADGDPSALRLQFDSGLVVSGADLQPTMPTFGLATVRGDRDPRRFAQWWVTPWRPEMMRGGRFGVALQGDSRTFLRGDVGAQSPGAHHGLSLGQSPSISVYRLMHEGEYRLPVHQPIDRAVRRSWTWRGDAFAGTYGIRLVVLDDEAGGALWQTAAAPRGEVVTAIWARAGRSMPAELRTPSGAVTFELGGAGPWRGAGGELRYVPTGEYEGWYLLRTAVDRPGPLTLGVRPRQQMRSGPRYFLPETRPDPPVPADWSALPVVAAASVTWAREAPPWRPVAVY